MATVEGYLLSPSERLYIRHGAQADLRLDGRDRLTFRSPLIELNPVPQAAGSARVQLGGTEVLCSVKGDIAEPTSAAGTQGRVVFSVDMASGAAIGQPREGEDQSARQEEAAVRAAILQRLFGESRAFDPSQLCIVPGRFVWDLSLDILILRGGGGNLTDAMTLAAHASLLTVRLPKVTVEEGEAVGLSLSDDPSDLQSLQCGKLPLTVTFALFGGDSNDGGWSFVADPDAAEEASADGLFTLGVNAAGCIVMSRRHRSPLALGPCGRLSFEAMETLPGLAGGLFGTLMGRIESALNEDHHSSNGSK